MLGEREIQEIVLRIVRACDPEVVGIFGSYAVGLAGEHSDLDVFVIQRTGERPAERVRRMRGALLGVLHAVDLQVFTPEEYEAGRGEEHSFAHTVRLQSRVLYRRPGGRLDV
jgi:predicted nucleotidyltransferase